MADRDEAELAAALDQLAGAGLVTRRGVPPAAGYLFKHALVRDAAYGTLLRDRRRRLHGRIARALEERSPELAETAPELIAHHLTEAGEAGRAVGYWLKAGRRSAERSAEREAVRQLRRGLDALATLPPSADRDRLELEFQLALGPRLVSTSGYTSPDAVAAYERARALCESLDDVGRLIPALYGLYAQHVMRGECRAALDLAERVRAAAERGGDPVERLLGHRTVGTALMQLGSLREARSELEAAVALHDPRRDRSLAAPYIIDPHATGLAYLALVLWMLGYPDQARGAAREAIRYAAELEHASTTNDVRFHAGAQLAALLGDCRAAEAHAHAVTTVASEYRLQAWWGFGAVLRGWALARDGRAEEGLALARRGVAHDDALGNMWHGPRLLVLLAEIHARLGDLAEALRLVERAQGQVRAHRGRPLAGRRAPGRGRVAAARGRARSRCRGVLPRGPGRGPAAGGQVLRAARGDEPRPALARPGSPGRGPRSARSRLRLVHRGLRHGGPAGREDAARRAPVARSTAGIAAPRW